MRISGLGIDDTRTLLANDPESRHMPRIDLADFVVKVLDNADN